MPDCPFCHIATDATDDDGCCADVFGCWWRFLDRLEAEHGH